MIYQHTLVKYQCPYSNNNNSKANNNNNNTIEKVCCGNLLFSRKSGLKLLPSSLLEVLLVSSIHLGQM